MTADLQQRLDEALDLARRAQRERAIACSNLTEAQGELRELRLELSAARELLAYHGFTPIEDDA